MNIGPSVTPERIEAVIEWEYFHVVPGTTMTICVLGLESGFTVTGESACVCRESFDEALGKQIARENAKDKIWQLEGYRLACQLNEEG